MNGLTPVWRKNKKARREGGGYCCVSAENPIQWVLPGGNYSHTWLNSAKNESANLGPAHFTLCAFWSIVIKRVEEGCFGIGVACGVYCVVCANLCDAQHTFNERTLYISMSKFWLLLTSISRL
jgi:hypothetical protein